MDMASIGIRDFSVFVNPDSAMLSEISRHRPTGGVTRPMQRLKFINMPKWSMSMPNAFKSGVRTGTIITTAAFASISIPIIRNRMLMRSRTRILLLVMAVKVATNC